MPSFELQTAIAAAMRASIRVLEIYAGDFAAEVKIGVDQFDEPVTEADRAASRIIVAEIGKAFPADAILSEEEPDDPVARSSKQRVWIIDPIDGTAGFVKRDGDFAIQIGLAENGKPIVGVVYLPAYDILYYAEAGAGAFRRSGGQEVRLTVSDTTDLSAMTMAVSRNHRSSKMNEVLADFGVRGEVSRGSVGLKMGLIADRACDLYIHLSHRTKLWDTCAPQMILAEAGGRVTDLFGSEIRYDVEDLQNHGGICATNGISHSEVIHRLRPLLDRFGRARPKSSHHSDGGSASPS